MLKLVPKYWSSAQLFIRLEVLNQQVVCLTPQIYVVLWYKLELLVEIAQTTEDCVQRTKLHSVRC